MARRDPPRVVPAGGPGPRGGADGRRCGRRAAARGHRRRVALPRVPERVPRRLPRATGHGPPARDPQADPSRQDRRRDPRLPRRALRRLRALPPAVPAQHVAVVDGTVPLHGAGHRRARAHRAPPPARRRRRLMGTFLFGAAALVAATMLLLLRPWRASPLGRGTTLSLAIGVPLVALGGYALLGTPAALLATPAVSGNAAHEAGQIDRMVAGLAARLQANPDDPKGWAMLGRSYHAMG